MFPQGGQGPCAPGPAPTQNRDLSPQAGSETPPLKTLSLIQVRVGLTFVGGGGTRTLRNHHPRVPALD